MNAPDLYRTWVDANQRLLVAEIARLKRRLGVETEADANALGAAVEAASAAMPQPSAIDHLAVCCSLSDFERDVVLLCAGVEMDPQLAARCASATGDARQPGATFELALASLEAPHWSALTPSGPLRRWQLVDVDDSAGLARGLLRIDERILHYLAGANYLDVRLGSLLRPVLPPATMAETQRAVADDARRIVETSGAGAPPLLWLTGDDGHGQADVAASVAVALGLGLHMLPACDVPAGNSEIEALATLWQREAMLLGSALLLRGGADPLSAAAIRFVEQLRGLVFISASQPQTLERPARRLQVDKPGPVEQKQLWQQALGAGAARLNGALDGIASQFKLSARTIQLEGTRLAPALAASERPDRVVWSACRSIGGSGLDELAHRIEPVAGWGDLVLPEAQKAVLQQIGSHVRNRLKVHDVWGFSEKSARGFGISALFAGESGTGKTMAAEVLARELQIDLYRIDLSAVVSKYIGETEKNLRRVFDAAEDSGAILLFDEADALFGKRSDVKDSHDRYANIEVSYLLQRMESYRGLAILTTNLKAALDTAFQRRLRFVVHFPFPDQTLRKAIWQNAFPARTPRGHIDCEKLACLSVTGGSIRNIAINAAFRAAELDEPVSMAHLLYATRHEAHKRERPLSDAEIRGWE